MNLYLWEDVLWGYMAGIAFAVATSTERAREVIIAKYISKHPDSGNLEDYIAYRKGNYEGKVYFFWKELDNEPTEISHEEGFFMWGSD